MTHQNTHIEPGASQTVFPAPGERLRLAREASGLTPYQVAGMLKLDAAKIEELERGQISGLGAPVFVTGYLRAYARLLNLPEQEILGAFNVTATIAPPVFDPSAKNFGKASRELPERMSLADSGRRSSRVAMAVLGVMLIAGAYLAWDHYQPLDLLDKPAAESADNLERSLASGALLPSAPASNTSAVAGNQNGATAATAVLPALSPADNPAVTAQSAAAPTATLAASNTPTPAATASRINAQPAVDAAVEAAATADTAPLASAAALPVVTPFAAPMPNRPQQDLTLFLSGESWMNIADASGSRLVYRLGKSGDVVNMRGTEPFDVTLGYLPAVKILVNGQAYDLSAYEGREAIRFRLVTK